MRTGCIYIWKFLSNTCETEQNIFSQHNFVNALLLSNK